MADTPKHSVSVAGVVVDDQGRILVIQRRDNGHWEPPGGVLELDETPEEGVRREILEETGIHVEVGNLSGVYKNMNRAIIALVFRCRPVSGTLARTDESRNVAWVPVGQVEELMDEAYAVRVTDCSQLDPQVRAHDGVELVNRNLLKVERRSGRASNLSGP